MSLNNPALTYPSDVEDKIIEIIDSKLGSDVIKADYYAGELYDETTIMRLATSVKSYPYALVAVGGLTRNDDEDPSQLDRFQGESISGTIFICSSNQREFRKQHKAGIRLAYLVKAAVEGEKIIPENSSETYVTIGSIIEQVNAPGICVYSVEFSIDVTHDNINDN